jgi:hypothetical protein
MTTTTTTTATATATNEPTNEQRRRQQPGNDADDAVDSSNVATNRCGKRRDCYRLKPGNGPSLTTPHWWRDTVGISVVEVRAVAEAGYIGARG